MTLSEKINAYTSGDTSLRKELLPRTQKACTYLIDAINDTEGGYAVIQDDPNIQQAEELIDAVMGETQKKFLIMTAGVTQTISPKLHNT